MKTTCQILVNLSLCLLLVTVVSCSNQQAACPNPCVGQSENPQQPQADQPAKRLGSDPNEVLVTFDGFDLTVRHIKWLEPGADTPAAITQMANWWLENELFYREACRRNMDKDPKIAFIAEMRGKREVAQHLVWDIKNTVRPIDVDPMSYYEQNKDTDPRLVQPGYISFTHITAKTEQEAQAALDKVKAGEDIGQLATQLSTHPDAKNGGHVQKFNFDSVERFFGKPILDALMTAKPGDVIGPIKSVAQYYEVIRFEEKVDAKPLPFENVRDQIRLQLMRTKQAQSLNDMIETLKKRDADKITVSQEVQSSPGRKTEDDNKAMPDLKPKPQRGFLSW